MDDCQLSVVFLGEEEQAHRAWKRRIKYTREDGAPQEDILYASVTNGDLLTLRHQIDAALTLKTYDCEGREGIDCYLRIKYPDDVNYPADDVVDNAHKNFYLAYQYYWNRFGRDSIDGAGQELRAFVHFGVNLNNAASVGNTGQFICGDGDGKRTTFFVCDCNGVTSSRLAFHCSRWSFRGRASTTLSLSPCYRSE